MKTTININGLDVEFTDEVPTRVGYYLCIDKDGSTEDDVEPVRVTDRYGLHAMQRLASYDNLWSAPFVPVTEVRKAYKEGWDQCDEPLGIDRVYPNSNARKVVEGCK